MNVDFKKLQKSIEISQKSKDDNPRGRFSSRSSGVGDNNNNNNNNNNNKRVKDKRRNPIQITAEQILRVSNLARETFEYGEQKEIQDKEEYEQYVYVKRTEFEREVAKNKFSMSKWIKYAKWEENLKYYQRCRSIFERALEVDYKDHSIWLRYAEMELRNKFVNHARNVYDRATTLLPRVDMLWFKYTYLEEMLGNVHGARDVYDRWLKWLPNINAFKSYVKMESRYNEFNNARKVLEKMIMLYKNVSSWMYYVKFELKHGNVKTCRAVFERAVATLGNKDEQLFLEFAKFEEKNKEYERARAIYKFALDNLPKKHIHNLYRKYLVFEKRYGNKGEIDSVILSKKRLQFEGELKEKSQNYDTWFDYIYLEELSKDVEKIRDLYERAIAQIPPIEEKKYWKRYIYFWIKYAIYEETETKDFKKTREIFKACLDVIPHKKFSFSKIWILYAQFEVRRKNVDKVRKILGTAIGMAPREKVFQEYIRIEVMLGNIQRTRKLYEKFLEYDTSNSEIWIQYAQLERKLGELERCRGIFELGISQDSLDMPEGLWKNYIDFEIEIEEDDNVRKLYSRLLEKTKHVKVWLSFAEFEISIDEMENARDVFVKADKYLKEGFFSDDDEKTEFERKEQRVVLLNNWKDFEEKYGNAKELEFVKKKLPRKVKRKRKIVSEDGKTDAGYEEFYDYIFQDDEKTKVETSKLLELAMQWKMNKKET